jgi:hypothetical protein
VLAVTPSEGELIVIFSKTTVSSAKNVDSTPRKHPYAQGALLALSLMIAASPTWARVYYVDPAGNDRASGTSPKTAWRTINFAVGKNSPVREGDEVRVAAGSYTENVTVQKMGTASMPVTLKGIGDVVVKDPSPDSGRGDGVVKLINVKHVIVDNIAVHDAYFFGFLVRGSDHVILQNVRTLVSGASGIMVGTDKRTGTRSTNIKILGSEVAKSCYTFSETGQGGHEAISIVSVDGFEVANTKVFGGKKEGITVKASARNGSVHHNTVFDQQRVGLYVGALGGTTQNIAVYNNLSYRNVHGIVAVNEGNGHTENVSIYNNVVYDNLKRGIAVAAWGVGPDHDINDVKIINNTVTRNGVVGIIVDNPEATNVVVRNNISYQNAGRPQIRVTKGQAVVERNLVTNPRFRNAAANDFAVRSDSPAIDSAIMTNAPDTDFLDQKRPKGQGPDIGAYEIR